jgi:DNA repair protein RadC
MIVEINIKLKKHKVNTAEKAFTLLLSAFEELDDIDQEKEHFYCIGLKRNREVKFMDLVSVGTLSGTLVHSREVFRRAIQMGVDAIIIAHNHPSGNMRTSVSDDLITKSLTEAGKIIGIEVLDHIVFCRDEFYSYAENGML